MSGASAPNALAPHEPTAWLRTAVAQRMALIDQMTDLPEHGVIVGPLGRPTGLDSPEDLTCDRCRAYCPNGDGFWAFHVRPRHDVALIAGLCAVCASKEGIR